MLLWRGATSAAQRIDPYLSSVNRPLLDARLAFLTNAADAGGRDAATTGADRDNPGFIHARATWLLNTRQVAAARACADIENTPVPLRHLWNVDTCPANLLPWLAWA